jgi:uncharacterized YccA/Bax inhibitor family protein
MATAFKSSNPALNEKNFERGLDTEPGWAAGPPPGAIPGTGTSPLATTDAMTLNGTVWATAALLVLVVGGGVFGWTSVDTTAQTVSMPGWFLPVLFGALGVAVLTIFKPNLARGTAPVYAILEGACLGAISGLYNAIYDGIVLQAVSLTIGVFAMMLFLYATRIIRVTEKLRMGIIAATGAVLLLYVVNMVLRLFGADLPFLHDSSAIGIGISLVIVGVAAFNLMLDFDFIERAVAAGAPRKMEWFAAFGLLVTIVWLYLEVLRLLGRLQGGR